MSNSAPVLGGLSSTVTYTEQAAALVLDGSITLTDSDDTQMAGATVTISAGFTTGDTLVFTAPAGSGITGSFNSNTHALTLSGTSDIANYITALESVKFHSSSDDPTKNAPSRTLSWQVTDASATASAVETSTVNVTAVNDAPGGSFNPNFIHIFATKGAPIIFLDSVIIEDVDDTQMASSTVRITSGFQSGDMLNFTNTAHITGSYDAVTGVLTLTGTAPTAEYSSAWESITFSNPSDDPTADGTATSRGVAYQLTDANSDGVGAATSGIDISQSAGLFDLIRLQAPPVLGGLGSIVSYAENAAALVLDGAITLRDDDDTQMAGATVTISAGFTAGDTLDFTAPAGSGITGSYSSGTHVLTLSGTSSTANYIAALQSVTFGSLSDQPTAGGSSRTISWQVTDANSDTLGAVSSVVKTSKVNVTAVNDAPVLGGLGSTIGYTEQAAATVLDGSITLTDTDDTQMGGATVTIGTGFTAGDTLAFTAPAGSGITGSYNIGTHVLTLLGVSSSANYVTALQSVTFASASDDPTAGGTSRTISWQVRDLNSGGAGTGSAFSAVQTSTVTITPVNDAPVNHVPGAQTTNEDTALVFSTANGNAISVADVDPTVGNPETVTLLVQHGTLTLGSTTGLQSFTNNNSVVVLSGSLASLNSALQGLSYTPAADYHGADSLSVTIDDNGNTGSPFTALSDHDTVVITVNPVNDAPVLGGLGGTVGYTEQAAFTVLDGSITLTDADDTQMAGATVAISAGFTAGDALVFTTPAGSGITGSFDSGTHVLTLSGASSNANYITALQSVKFASNSYNPTAISASRTISWQVTDANSDGTGAASSALQTSTITITPVNNAPEFAGDLAIKVAEGGSVVVTTADLTANDPDNTAAQLVFTVTATSHGQVLLSGAAATSFTKADIEAGLVTFQHDGGETDGQFVVTLSDGVASVSPGGPVAPLIAGVTATVDPHVNDAPDAGPPVKLAPIDMNSGAHLIGQAQLLANASDVDGPSLTAINLQIDKGFGALADNHDGSWTYTPKINDDTGVTFTYQVTDGVAAPLADSATLDIVPAQASPQIGTPGDDFFTAVTGNAQYDAGAGIDTITFGFKLTEATVTWSGNKVIIDGPASHTVLSGFEIYKFTDGTVNNNDADPLVDDLFYYARNRDVWNAHADADAHYHASGWHEGRDPNAFFSTATYLSLNPDVKAAGVDPLVQFDQAGWNAGRAPSIAFDPAAYLAANPDVKAAHVDPLAHFLANGAQEGRQPIAFDHLLAANGFDYVYYLQHNPDVAAAHIDPFQHFETVGWQEGRNPNALFDTKGYLGTYADVAAAHINPLDHYNTSGWHEGRDPSAGFDTTDYLSHYPDVAAAHINPLVHFLTTGQTEGRSPFADGHFG